MKRKSKEKERKWNENRSQMKGKWKTNVNWKETNQVISFLQNLRIELLSTKPWWSEILSDMLRILSGRVLGSSGEAYPSYLFKLPINGRSGCYAYMKVSPPPIRIIPDVAASFIATPTWCCWGASPFFAPPSQSHSKFGRRRFFF